jgi:hypothetical protein
VQVLLFAILAVEIKRKAPTTHTCLEIVKARWGTVSKQRVLSTAARSGVWQSAACTHTHTHTHTDTHARAVVPPIGCCHWSTSHTPALPASLLGARGALPAPQTAHLVFLVFCLLTNVIVTSMLILGGASVVNALTGVNLCVRGVARAPRQRPVCGAVDVCPQRGVLPALLTALLPAAPVLNAQVCRCVPHPRRRHAL